MVRFIDEIADIWLDMTLLIMSLRQTYRFPIRVTKVVRKLNLRTYLRTLSHRPVCLPSRDPHEWESRLTSVSNSYLLLRTQHKFSFFVASEKRRMSRVGNHAVSSVHCSLFHMVTVAVLKQLADNKRGLGHRVCWSRYTYFSTFLALKNRRHIWKISDSDNGDHLVSINLWAKIKL